MIPYACDFSYSAGWVQTVIYAPFTLLYFRTETCGNAYSSLAPPCSSIKKMTQKLRARIENKLKLRGEEKAKLEKDQSSTSTLPAEDSRQRDNKKGTDVSKYQ